MANFYKNQGFKLGTTNLTTVVTTNTSSVVIVKGMNLINEHSSSVLVECFLHDSSAGTDFEFFRADIPTNTTQFNAAGQAINLEAGDAIKAKSETANKIEGVISFLQIDRSQENG
tara:strand:+ start:42 stop:386 length:345 start_codon:yes stop_codon:yes gene_type:complete